MSAFAAVTAVRRVSGAGSAATFRAELDAGWSVGGKPNGGYLLALLARAALESTDRPHALAVSGHFLRPPAGGAADVQVEVLKTGRTVSTARTTLVQDGVTCLEALVSTGELTEATPDWSARVPPSLPPPDECLSGQPEGFRVELLDHVDVRLDPHTAPMGPGGPTGTPELQGWVRFHDGAEVDTLALALVADVMPPTTFNLSRFGWSPTVELTVLLRAVPAPGWLACVVTTELVAGGWFDENVEVWDESGRLVAQARQLARVGG